ncbi:hypothetical protein E4U23_005077 [Claviceps purpurea]|nr:hypothetical protein E4U23_005077 [Claviceps purpurea]
MSPALQLRWHWHMDLTPAAVAVVRRGYPLRDLDRRSSPPISPASEAYEGEDTTSPQGRGPASGTTAGKGERKTSTNRLTSQQPDYEDDEKIMIEVLV